MFITVKTCRYDLWALSQNNTPQKMTTNKNKTKVTNSNKAKTNKKNNNNNNNNNKKAYLC